MPSNVDHVYEYMQGIKWCEPFPRLSSILIFSELWWWCWRS